MCVDILLENGADLYATDGAGRTALHYAARSPRGGCVALLLERARVRGVKGRKQTPLGYAQ
jgi:ankyrin repeat protein